jgi:PilZ domain
MSEALLLELAVGVLGRLPLEVRASRDDGGTIALTILEPRDARLHCSLSVLDAREGLKLTIPVDTGKRGGYSIGCEIDQILFMGGLDSAARLTITEVTRRRAYRTKERIDTTDVATLEILSSAHHRVGECLLARAFDISPGGIGFTSEIQVDRGDRVRVDTAIAGITIHAEALVVQTSTAPFGRFRAGCQFTRLPLATQHALEAFTAATKAA